MCVIPTPLRARPFLRTDEFRQYVSRAERLISTCPDKAVSPADGGAAADLAFHAFPTLEQLAEATEQGLRDSGFGYRWVCLGHACISAAAAASRLHRRVQSSKVTTHGQLCMLRRYMINTSFCHRQ